MNYEESKGIERVSSNRKLVRMIDLEEELFEAIKLFQNSKEPSQRMFLNARISSLQTQYSITTI